MSVQVFAPFGSNIFNIVVLVAVQSEIFQPKQYIQVIVSNKHY